MSAATEARYWARIRELKKRRNCHGKRKYADADAAAAGAERIEAKFQQKLRVYRCDVCNYHHLTSQV